MVVARSIDAALATRSEVWLYHSAHTHTTPNNRNNYRLLATALPCLHHDFCPFRHVDHSLGQKVGFGKMHERRTQHQGRIIIVNKENRPVSAEGAVPCAQQKLLVVVMIVSGRWLVPYLAVGLKYE